MTDKGLYRLTFDRANSPHSPMLRWLLPVGTDFIWESELSFVELYPAIKLEYLPPKVDPWARVEQLQKSLKELEWDKHDASCPVCGAKEPNSATDHGFPCWLAEELYGGA